MPAIGPENWFLSYWGAREYFKDDRKMLHEGYKKVNYFLSAILRAVPKNLISGRA